MPEIGEKGQDILFHSHVAVVGAGGLGYPVISYLAAAGIGRITIVDSDIVELTNLNRQLFYRTEDLGKKKAMLARKRIEAAFPDVIVDTHIEHLTSINVDALLIENDIIVDAVDNLSTRYVINRWAVKKGVPVIFGAVESMRGMVYVFDPGDPGKPCYECMFPQRKKGRPTPVPIVGAAAGVIGSWQAVEVVNYLCHGNSTGSGMLNIDIGRGRVVTRKNILNSSCFCRGERGLI